MKTNARKYISLLLALCMVMSLLPAAALAAGADDDHGEHSDWTALTNLGGTLTGGSYYLTGNLNASSGQISVTGTVNLCLNGHTLNLNEKSLCVDSGSFTLCDCKGSGKITGGKYLPGVIVYGGTFTMNGGTITGNGGGVIVGANPSSSASFTMNGGSITGNTVNTNVTTTYGGGVYVANGSSFTMTGGSITGNTVTGTAAMTASGGVLVVNSGSSFTMTGGEITNNQCDGTMSGNDFAGGVRVSSFLSGGSFTVSGDAVISGNTAKGSANNVSLTGSQTINIGSGGLSSGAEIGVTMASAGVFTTGGGESCRQYFFSDDDTYVVVPSNGELALGLVSSNPHTHCVCGETLCNEHGGEQTFDPLSSLSSTIGPGNYYLTKNLTNGTNGHITVSGNVTLCLNGRTLDLDGHHFIVNSGGSLTICDCGSGGTITGGQAEQGGAVLVNSGGSLTLHSGSITGNTASGGGDGSSGSNRAGGGAVCVNGGSFNMTGGSIENNTANVTKKNDGGGGVLINSGSFTMSGGSITDNSVSGHDDSTGGGVHVNSGTFTMTGGAIANNNAKNGGGVTVFKSNSTANSSFILSGGRITNNSATTAGGIYVLPNTEFKLSGEPAISGNTADGADSNIYLNGPVITLTGALSNATPYGVSMARPGEFTSGGGATYIDNFTSDDSNLDVQISGDELCLSSGFTVSFDLNGGTGIASEQKVQRGGKATDPGKPTRDDHAFAGWYNGDTLWNFDTVVTGNMILTAKWITNPTVTVTGDTSLTYGKGGTLTASVSPAGQNYTYQWSCNGNAISGATGSSYTIPADTAVGTYTYSCTVTASIAGSSKTARATSDAVTVTVSAKGYDSNSFTVSDIADQTYTGSQIKPEPEVKFGDITLQKGTDYTLGYGTNINVGTGSVTITFKGNYSGETTVYFDIVKAAQTAPGDGEGYTIYYAAETITVESGYEVTPRRAAARR
ncbi:MAG: InlB B-repeat-containing protein [Oscillospiraceae bacterium]